MEKYLEFSLPAVPISVRAARETIAEVAARLGASQRVIDDARLCVSEAVTNAVRHAYENGDADVRIEVDRSETELTVIVRDDGVGLPDFQRDGDLGYGLRLIRHVTLQCGITSMPNHGTEVRMVFALNGAAATP